MTTKLEHSINPLITRSPHNNFAVNTLIILKSPMDRLLESQKIESMRKMMLMQEQVFRQQVEELHRLYNLQKEVMQDIENGLKLRKETAAKTNRTISEFTIRPQIATETKQSFQPFCARNDPKEASGSSNSAENARMPIKFDLETTPSSSIHQFEEQKELKRPDEEADVEVELTLSIGHCTRKPKSHFHNISNKLELQECEDHQPNEARELGSSSNKTDKGEAYGHQSSIISSSSAYQENTRPHWLLQDLSLNRT